MAFKAAIGTLSVKISADTSDVRRGIKATNKDLSKSGKALKKNEQEWKRWGATTKLIITGVVVLAARELIRYSDAFTSLTNKLKLSTNGTRELANITKTLFDVSRDTRTSVESTVDLYTKMERATRNLDISQERLVKITSSINKAFAISGATTQETSGSIRQLGQAFASGTLRGDEFNSIAEQAPIIMEAVKEATGKTAGELRELAATGVLSTEILIESLERYAQKIDTDFAQATATFSQKLENARTNAIEFVGANDAITGSVGVLGDSVLGLSNNLDVLLGVGKAVAVIYGGILTGSLVAATAAKIAAIKASSALAATEIKNAKLTQLSFAETAALRIKSSRDVAAALVIESRSSLIALNASKDEAVQAVINARATDRVTTAFVLQSEAELARATAITVVTGDMTIQTAVEKQLAAAKIASANASNVLVAAETGVSISANKVAAAKTAAAAAATNLTVAKNASSISSQRLTAANIAMTASTKAASIAATGLRGALAFLGGPVGALLTAAAALAIFVDWETDAEKATEKATEKIDKQIASLKGLNAVQLGFQNQNFDAKMRGNLKAVADTNEKIDDAVIAQKKLLESYGQSTKGVKIQNTEIIKLRSELKLLLEEQERLQKVGAAIFDIGIAPKLPTGDQDLIDIEGKAAEKKEEKRNEKALQAFSRHLLKRNQMEAKAAVALREQKLKQAENDLAALNQKLLSEQGLESFFHQQDLTAAQTAFDEGLITKAERDKIIEDLERQHQQTTTNIQRSEQSERSAGLSRALDDAATILSVGGKKTLKITKALSIASAIIKGKEAAVDAWEFGMKAGGPVVAGIMSAASVVTTAAMIRSIASGGSTSAPTSSGGGAASGGGTSGGGQVGATPQQQQASRTISINFTGQGLLSSDQVRELIEQINEQTGDGVELRVGG